MGTLSEFAIEVTACGRFQPDTPTAGGQQPAHHLAVMLLRDVAISGIAEVGAERASGGLEQRPSRLGVGTVGVLDH